VKGDCVTQKCVTVRSTESGETRRDKKERINVVLYVKGIAFPRIYSSSQCGYPFCLGFWILEEYFILLKNVVLYVKGIAFPRIYISSQWLSFLFGVWDY